MSLATDYYIKPLRYEDAMRLVLANHYMHRKPQCSYAFGLFRSSDDKVKGCVTFGSPPSSTLIKSICGEDESDQVIELNRLWVAEDVPRNGESYLIMHSIKQVPKDIIVSFADTGYNHVGYIYQACNFYFTGQTSPQKDVVIKNHENIHHRTLEKTGVTRKQLKNLYGEDFQLVDRSIKNRYIYFNCNRKRKKELLQKLNYPILPYPKGESKKVEINDDQGSTPICLFKI